MSQPSHDVLGGTGDVDDQHHGRRRSSTTRPGLLPAVLLTATFVAIALAAVLTFVGLPYVVMSPGPATNILGKVDGKPLLSVQGAPTYPTSGSLDFTTVSVDGGPGVRVTVYDLAQAWLSGSQEILPEEQVFPPQQSEEDAQEEGAAEMAGSQSVATATALRAVGKTVPEMVVIAGVPDGSPSKGVFEADDVLVSVDGDPASSSDAVRAAVQRHQPGDTFPVVVRRDGKEQTVTAKTAESDGRTVHGRQPAPRLRPAGRRHAAHRQRGRAVGRADVQPRHLRRADPRRAHRRQEHRRYRHHGRRGRRSGRSAASGRS